MKITKRQLRRLINEELEAMLPSSSSPAVADAFSRYLGQLRGVGLWFHGAHHFAKGVGFAGDHVELYGEIYTALFELFDGAAEKAIGITKQESVACPLKVTGLALDTMRAYRTPSDATQLEIATEALRMMEDHKAEVEKFFYMLEAEGQLPLGLNDFLAASANNYETYCYLLQQRVKGL